MPRKYGKKASEKVAKALHEWKRGTLRSGSGGKVTSQKQAIAIGLSQARARGYKMPPAPSHATKTLHLFTYRNKHGAWSDVWATDAEHAKQLIRDRKDAAGFFTINRVTNVAPREAHATKSIDLRRRTFGPQPTAQDWRDATKAQIEQALAAEVIRRNPKLYAGYDEDAVKFVRNTMGPTKWDLLLAAQAFGLAPEGTYLYPDERKGGH